MTEALTEEFDVEYDLVVVGGGGSGMSCAVQAGHNGLTVAVLEKMPTLGGSSSFAEGHAAFESDEQEKRGIHVSKDEAFQGYIDYSHWRADASVVSRFVENANKTIVKMRNEGAVYEEVITTAPDQPDELVTWHIPKGEVAHVIDLLEASARSMGVEIFLQTSAKQMLMKDGKIVGVVAEDADGQPVRIGAKAVVVGTGGYASNPEMLNKFTKFGCGDQIINIGNPGNTGDGLNMMFDVGAQPFESIGTTLLMPLMRGKTVTSHTNTAGFQPYLWVNRDGRRCTNEICGLNFGNAGDVVAGLPGSFYWSVIDQAQIDHLVDDGCEVGLGIYVRTGEKLVNLPTELESDVEAGLSAFKGDTIEDLATAIGVDPAVLAAEIAEYNTLCHAGKDTKFHKAKYLLAVEKGPFYAIKMEPGIMVTMGGIKINDNMQVIGADGKPIEGLYSVGCDAGGLFGESYILTIPGSANGFALTSGWLAADHATAAIRQNVDA
ncbi:FAD-dependent oxidoreductase [Pengzhenrongella frigida]|uniref:FAD-dependent oxidoreductase n=1 Tax=Pengzhenrongella frigida TaxID=1259133 RepID=UPI001A911B19|nr:FAD-dependent oxidoreductase [Cellulomonas sp. HLT2-17]